MRCTVNNYGKWTRVDFGGGKKAFLIDGYKEFLQFRINRVFLWTGSTERAALKELGICRRTGTYHLYAQLKLDPVIRNAHS